MPTDEQRVVSNLRFELQALEAQRVRDNEYLLGRIRILQDALEPFERINLQACTFAKDGEHIQSIEGEITRSHIDKAHEAMACYIRLRAPTSAAEQEGE